MSFKFATTPFAASQWFFVGIWVGAGATCGASMMFLVAALAVKTVRHLL